mmetsp:Transcript_14528/g.20516  ORF Transcript_14528/g.20516 Transcript_14528/m.20516 type:complete len:175 (-) Transcript_14528:273-797(-)
MSILSSVRFLARQSQRQRSILNIHDHGRSLSSLSIRSSTSSCREGSSLFEKNDMVQVHRSSSSSDPHQQPPTIQFLHKEVHYSSSFEETIEQVIDMQKTYNHTSDDDLEHETFEKAVRSAVYNQTSTFNDRLCKVCGRDEISNLCDICADGMTVSQFIPDYRRHETTTTMTKKH